MLVSCSYCGRAHSRGFICENKPKRVKEANDINKFRWSRKWQNKSKEIKIRDKFLCQVCLLDNRYTFLNLEVHHIESLATNFDLCLSNDNLITLCAIHHKQADNHKIDKIHLGEIAKKNELRC